MSDPRFQRMDCYLCGNSIEFPRELANRVIECPHCGQSIKLFAGVQPPPGNIPAGADASHTPEAIGSSQEEPASSKRRTTSLKGILALLLMCGTLSVSFTIAAGWSDENELIVALVFGLPVALLLVIVIQILAPVFLRLVSQFVSQMWFFMLARIRELSKASKGG